MESRERMLQPDASVCNPRLVRQGRAHLIDRRDGVAKVCRRLGFALIGKGLNALRKVTSQTSESGDPVPVLDLSKIAAQGLQRGKIVPR
jgi:hypothetical protein